VSCLLLRSSQEFPRARQTGYIFSLHLSIFPCHLNTDSPAAQPACRGIFISFLWACLEYIRRFEPCIRCFPIGILSLTVRLPHLCRVITCHLTPFFISGSGCFPICFSHYIHLFTPTVPPYLFFFFRICGIASVQPQSTDFVNMLILLSDLVGVQTSLIVTAVRVHDTLDSGPNNP